MLENAVKSAVDRGVVVVAAAGNEPGVDELYPAAQSEVLAVSALSLDGTRLATFTNSGGWADVAAPGSDIAGPVPGGRYARWNGTSIAAPFVAGQVALIRAANPGLDAVKSVDVVTHTTLLLKPDGHVVNSIDLVRSLMYTG